MAKLDRARQRRPGRMQEEGRNRRFLGPEYGEEMAQRAGRMRGQYPVRGMGGPEETPRKRRPFRM